MSDRAQVIALRAEAAPGLTGRAIDACWRWLLGAPRGERALAAPPIPPLVHANEEPPRPAIARGEACDRDAPRFMPLNATARIIEAFDSAHPVRRRENLHGRDDKLEWLFEAVLFSRRHAIIHGARGSGKTSLSQVFGDYADQHGSIVIYTACEADATFEELIRSYLAFLPDSCVPLHEKEQFERERHNLPAGIGPRAVVDFLSRLSPDCQVILIFDEFDRVESPEVNAQIATLMKLLSDACSPVQILLVGIAQTIDDLITAHPSLRRHLVPIAIGRISPEDITTLIETGARRAGVQFDAESKAEIAATSCGSPYHTQLFCYVAALEAARRGRNVIDLELTHIGMLRAFDTWASLNQSDAALFRSLAAAGDDVVRSVAAAAREAAADDSLSVNAPGAGLLAPALRKDREGDRYFFRDTAAPQLLLAILACRRGAAGSVGAEVVSRHHRWG